MNNKIYNSLLTNESPMQLLPSLAGLMGADCALFTQQLHYLLSHSKNHKEGRYWVYNTLDEWNAHFFWWSKATLRRIISRLKALEIDGEIYHVIISKNLNDCKLVKRLWYTIDYDELERLIPLATAKKQLLQEKILKSSMTVADNNNEKTSKQNSKNIAAFYEENITLTGEFEDIEPADNDNKSKSQINDSHNEHINEDCYERDDFVENSALSADPLTAELDKSADLSNSKAQYDPFEEFTAHLSTIKTLDNMTLDYLSSNHQPGKTDDNDDDPKGKYLAFKKACIAAGIKMPKDITMALELIKTYYQDIIHRAIARTKEYGGRSLYYLKQVMHTLQTDLEKGADNDYNKHQFDFNGQRDDISIHQERAKVFWAQYGF